jgi:hypothetical protein
MSLESTDPFVRSTLAQSSTYFDKADSINGDGMFRSMNSKEIMEKNKFIIRMVLTILTICISGCIYASTSQSSRIPITFDSAGTPVAIVEIQGEEFFLDVTLGSKLQLELSKSILNTLEKEPYGKLERKDLKGVPYEEAGYLISEIKIGDRSFSNMIVGELSDDTTESDEEILNRKFGTIGRALLEKMNLLLDFRNSVMIGCNDTNDVEQAGYRLESMTMIPFESGRDGNILTVHTDLGKLRLAIATGCTVSLIRSSLLQDNELEESEYGLPCFTSSQFMIGNKDFGELNLYLYDITPEFDEIDGVLGMNFLKRHVVYIDFQNNVLYVGKSIPESSQISVTFNSANIPVAKVEVQGKEFPLIVDLGSISQLDLSKDILNNLEKRPYGKLETMDIKGNLYESPRYLVSEIKIGGHSFFNVIVGELNEDFVLNTTIYTTRSNEEILNSKFGFIGRSLLERMNLLLDLSNSVMIGCNDIADVEKSGYPLENMVMIPFESGYDDDVFIVNTDFGELRLFIDTGSTLSVIRSSLLQDNEPGKCGYGLPCFSSSQFVIGNRDFGELDLHLYDIAPEWDDIDGVLGMDFLEDHIVYIDYQNKLLYVGDCTEDQNTSEMEAANF